MHLKLSSAYLVDYCKQGGDAMLQKPALWRSGGRNAKKTVVSRTANAEHAEQHLVAALFIH
jgi:hypothetical protein